MLFCKRLLLVMLFIMSLTASKAQASSEAWDYADQVAEQMEEHWSEEQEKYKSSRFHLTVNMLTVFSAAKLADHEGPARKDNRIAPLARSLLSSPTYITTPEELKKADSTNPHIPGFTTSFSGDPGYQHVAISAQASRALGMAAKSGALPEDLKAEIAGKLGAVAKGRQFTYPRVEANQVSWPMMVWAGYARASDDYPLAGSQISKFMQLWVRTMRRPIPGYKAPNLSAGLGLHYFPEYPLSSPINQTASTEYASVIFAGFDIYKEMLGQGMPRLSPAYEEKMRRWSDRLTRGEWTHSGWPNWDTGLGYERWQLINYFAWCVDGLVALSATPHLSSGESRQRAAYLIYQALDRFKWLEEQGFPGSTRYGVKSDFTRSNDFFISKARLGASAAMLALRGIERPQDTPEISAWYDREMKRLAVSTPHYSSAIITPFNRIGYGGLDPARLLDNQGRPLTSLGLTPSQGGMVAFKGSRTLGSSTRLSRQSLASWKAGDGKKVFLSGRSGRLKAKTSFMGDEVMTRYRLPRGAWGRLRIPFWGELTKAELEPSERQLIVRTENDEGAKLTVIIRSLENPQGSWQKINPPRMSPRSKQSLEIKSLRGKVTVLYRPGR